MNRTGAWLGVVLLLVAPACTTHSATPSGVPGGRAGAEPLGLPGLPNAYRVSDELYRGAQPEPEGFRQLHRLGIRTIVNLRQAHSDVELIQASGVGPDAFELRSLPMAAWDVGEEEVLTFLRIVNDPALRPVFVHCQHGSDRTGTMVAAYRVVMQGWTKQEAVQEMRRGPFGFHAMFSNLPHFLRELDVLRVRRELDDQGKRSSSTNPS